MSLIQELSKVSRYVPLGLQRCTYGCRRFAPTIQLLNCHIVPFQQRAAFQNKTSRFKLPPVPKDKEKKVFKKKKSQDEASSGIPQELVSTSPSPDDVWRTRYFPNPEFTFLEAINRHREYAHPEMTDNSDGVVTMEVDLDLTSYKKTKFLSAPTGLVLLPHNFDNFFPNRVIAITKSNEDQTRAEKAGAIFIGAQDLVKKLEKGEIKAEDYDHVVMNDDMVVEASVIKKLLKDHFPSKKNGSLGKEIDYMVQLFRVGKEYQATKSSDEEGHMTFAFGKLDMTNEELVANIKSILSAVAQTKPYGKLFKSLKVRVPPSKEVFAVSDEGIMPVQSVDAKPAKNRKWNKTSSEDVVEAVVVADVVEVAAVV